MADQEQNQSPKNLSIARSRDRLRLSFGAFNRKKSSHDSPVEGPSLTGSIPSSGKLNISPEVTYDFTADDLKDLGEIGIGDFGTVNKMIHKKSDTIMAVKRIRSYLVSEKKQKKTLMDLEAVMKKNDCIYIVRSFGAIFEEGDCWICMVLMDTSLDKFYKVVHEELNQKISESFLGKVTMATLKALEYLKDKLKITCSDVKPSNILLDRRGNIKLGDFRITSQLVNPKEQPLHGGFRPSCVYMAPERIDPDLAWRGYDVRCHVWSLGLTLIEVSTGRFPYPKSKSLFEELTRIIREDPPQISQNENGNTFTLEFVNFVNTCLIKDQKDRPKYKKLLKHPFVLQSDREDINLAEYIGSVLDHDEAASSEKIRTECLTKFKESLVL